MSNKSNIPSLDELSRSGTLIGRFEALESRIDALSVHVLLYSPAQVQKLYGLKKWINNNRARAQRLGQLSVTNKACYGIYLKNKLLDDLGLETIPSDTAKSNYLIIDAFLRAIEITKKGKIETTYDLGLLVGSFNQMMTHFGFIGDHETLDSAFFEGYCNATINTLDELEME